VAGVKYRKENRLTLMTEAVVSRRLELGLSQRAAADAAGTSQQIWSRLELGRDVQFSTLDRAMLSLGVDILELISGCR
jgi:transcriptional regulator with XRE-family HTH domain